MAKEKQRAREPMLYIAQPDFKTVKPPMQHTYRSQLPTSKKAEPEAASSALPSEGSASNEQQEARTDTATKTRKERSFKAKEIRRRINQEFGLTNEETPPKEEAEVEDIWATPEQETSVEEKVEETPSEDAEAQVEPEAKAETEEEEAQAEKKQVTFKNRRRRERFKDMTLEEKVNYFVSLPSSVPRMKCEVMTDGESYKGWIEDYDNGIVYLKILQRPFRVEVPFDTIKDIALRGF